MALAELLSRIEAAAGPDRELDIDIMVAVTGGERMGPLSELYQFPDGPWLFAPSLTESVDSTLLLVERKLPGWRIFMEINRADPDDGYLAQVAPNLDFSRVRGATLPLAILNALVRALLTKASPQ